MRRAHCALLGLFAMGLAQPLQAVAAADPAETNPGGWFWYEDPPRRAEPTPEPQRRVVVAPAEPAKPEWRQRFDDFQRRMKESRMRFFIDPSPENARKMAELQTAMLRVASRPEIGG